MRKITLFALLALLLGGAESARAQQCPEGQRYWSRYGLCETLNEGTKTEERSGSYRKLTPGPTWRLAHPSRRYILNRTPPELRPMDNVFHTPYTCTPVRITNANKFDADIEVEHIVSKAEAWRSGLSPMQFLEFEHDLDNLTLATARENGGGRKSDNDPGGYEPPYNAGWYAWQVIKVKQKYGLSVDTPEKAALIRFLAAGTAARCN